MTSSQNASAMEQGNASQQATGRPVVFGTQGVISSGHYLTSMAGMRMLLAGGNAFDAVVASCFAAAVTEPIASYSLAAEGVFMLYHAESGDLLSLSGQGTAPKKATVDWYRSQGQEEIPTGPGPLAPMAFTVPGVVDALFSLLEKYGTKTAAEVLAPSIHYAERGIPNYDYMIERLESPAGKSQFQQFPPGGMDIFYEDGEAPKAGSLLVQSALGATLRKLVDAENAAPGHRLAGIKAARDAFYEGEVAEMIVDSSNSVGGILEREDLASYRAQYETPVKTSFMGHEVHGQSTWTQGSVMLQSLNILEHFDLQSMGHNSTTYVHTVAEAVKLAMADRQAYYGDPEFADVPIDGLLSKEYAAERAKLIDLSKAHPELPPAGDPWRQSKLTGAPRANAEPVASTGDGAGDDGGTTHISVIDRDGNMVCATPSGGSFAKSVFFPELGCALSTRIEMFNFEDGHPNRLEPGKRPRTTLINYIVTKDGVPVMTVGCPGGDHQAQGNLQILLNALVWGMNPQEAVEAPRFASTSVTNSFYPHTYYPGQLALEPEFPSQTVDELRTMGHQIVTVSDAGMGATVSVRDPENGVLSSGGDPRRACYALAW
ncbi:MAG: gamma-glutamyltransferase family protein [SAR202 cluster bacterium]|nr:gamma-glutamyltransferase family protein [SAR202 cluster bacterium]MDP6662471.1 gamma-glutamyltransferase family protein [SAR202 cluster bacterium]MQG56788.1 gamma-glutamyltransferase family protein [SAR202 cluster bacterium]MQG68160.1 gamma-glutamyltransferase family protein [SAR202 cluster bacterium]